MAPSQDDSDKQDSSSSSSSSSSPPPPSSSDSSSSPPPSSDQPSPPPPSSDKSSPPPPSDSSPPPPSPESSPPPPSPDESSSPPPSSPPPPKDSDKGSSSSSSSSPPPPKSSSGSSNSYPPPPKGRNSPPWHAPPPPRGSLGWSSDNPETGNETGKTALIVGVAVGGGLLLILLIVCIVACCRKKKRDKDNSQMNYFLDSEQADPGNGYYNNSTRYGNKIPPASSQYSSGQWLGAAPPPPPPGMTSSELNSANYSGQPPLPPPHPSLSLGFNQSSFTYQDLAAATGNFDNANLLGQGGFGYVHKGYLPNGKEIAVKSLKSGSGQGDREFQAEVDIISRVHHKHLVSLVGYCIADSQRMLVYEFVPNNSLEHHLYGKGQPVMDFPTRHKIALGAAKGFAYLHEDCHPRIIHRDIKAANILLDYNYEAKVADFGLAKLSNDTQTHVSTRIMGTFGYLAPEYASSGKLTEKSDVYSYGVVLLELITGKRPIGLSGEEEDSLVDWSRPILEKVTDGGSYEELVDSRLGENYNPEQMLCMVACAAACIRHSGRRRPRMSQVVRALEGDASLEDLNEVGRRRSSKFDSHGSSEFDSYGSRIRMVRPRSGGAINSSNEFTSGEHTSEYSIHASPQSNADSHEIRSNGSRRRTP